MSDPANNNNNSNPKPDDKKPKKPNTYYAGEGQAVEGAPADPRASIDALFEKAKANGARTPEEMTSYRSSAFGGAGRRLGHDQGPSVPVQPLTREEKSIKITFYRNGFTVDEGPLRNPNDPAEAAFLETLNRGFVPREISEKYPNTDVNVVMGDRGDEDYVPQFKAFEGSGNRLASSASAAPAVPAAAEAPRGAFHFSEEEPAGKVLVQLVDGTRMEVKVNPQRHTVADLRGVVASAAKVSPSAFDLIVRDVRPRPLADPTETLAAAKCVGCVVMVKAR